MGFPKIQMAVPAWQGQYSTTVTRQQGWQEEEAWRTSDGLGTQRHMASNGARPFGRTAALSEHENLARTNGHSTAHLTSWGHVRTWDTQRTDLTSNDRATRRSAVPPPNTDAMRQTLKGEGLADGAAEPVVLMSGHAIKPGPQRAPVANSPRRSDAVPWATIDNTGAPAKEEPIFDGVSGVALIRGSRPTMPITTANAINVQPGSVQPITAGGPYPSEVTATPRYQHTPRETFHVVGAAAATPPPPPPLTFVGGAPSAPLSQEMLDALFGLARALEDRRQTWASAFTPYDRSGTGLVSLSDLLRVFRANGLAIQPQLLQRSLPNEGLAYRQVEQLATSAPQALQGLQSASTGTVHVGRRPLMAAQMPQLQTPTFGQTPQTFGYALPPAVADTPAFGGAYAHPSQRMDTGPNLAPPQYDQDDAPASAGAEASFGGGGNGAPSAEAIMRRRRLHRLLTERAHELRRSPREMWAELRPLHGLATLSGLNDGLGRLGLHLGDHDLNELVSALSSANPFVPSGPPVVTCDAWLAFFSAGESAPSLDDPNERRRRITLSRLLTQMQGSKACPPHQIAAWLARRDTQRTGRVSLADFCAGLRAHGVLLSDSDVGLAAVEIDPEGGGTSLAYQKLMVALNDVNPTKCPMPWAA